MINENKIDEKDKEIYFLFFINVNNKCLYYISNLFSSRRVIFLKVHNIKNQEKNINKNINKIFPILEKKIKNHYYNVKRIYFMDNNLDDSEIYVNLLNNKDCVFIHLPFNKYKHTQILNMHIKIKSFIKKYIEKKVKETNLIINNNNLYLFQYYLNMKFVFIFNYHLYINDER